MLAAFVALFVATANAQTIKGVVTDADNGEPIIGATIKVKETSKAAVTDMNGKYSITGLTTGRYKSGKTKCARFEKRNVQKSGKTKRAKNFAHTTL